MFFASHRGLTSLCLIACTVVALGVVADAGTIRHDRYDEQYHKNKDSGVLSAVGRLHLNTPFGKAVCSGTYIGNGYVLTAAHCTESVTNMTFKVRGQTYEAEKWFAHKDYDGNTYYDVAVVKLKQDPGGKRAVYYNGQVDIGERGINAGYGSTGTGLTGNYLPAGAKRVGHNLIEDKYNNLLMQDFDRYPESYADFPRGHKAQKFDLPESREMLIAGGDSGGAMFIQGKIAGVHSVGISYDGSVDSDYGDWSGSVWAKTFRPWIEWVQIQENNGRSAAKFAAVGSKNNPLDSYGFYIGDRFGNPDFYFPDSFVSSEVLPLLAMEYPEFYAASQASINVIPEPGTALLLGAAGAGLLLRRRTV